jgi:hypothetical protein
MAIGQLINTISDDIAGAISSLLGSTSGQTYPNKPGGQDLNKITNVLAYNQGEWKSSQGYAFAVVRVSTGGTEEVESGWKEFMLQINPQELTQDEVFAIQVTPTFRGVVVEHQGVTLKDIVIQGVTGVSPLRREGGAKKKSGDPVLATGHSGFKEFHELRSYFRAYVEAKRLDGAGNPKGELRLVFRNYKDNEFVYVEPQKFTMKRSASKPFLYEYQIAMKGIGPAGVKKKAGSWISPITDIIDSAFDLIEYSTQIINGSIGLIRRTERNVSNTVLEPLRNINSALTAIRGGQAALFGPFGITRRFVSQLNAQLSSLEANLNEVFGVDISKYNAATGRVSTLKSTTSRIPTYQELRVLNAISSAKRGLLIILQDKALFVEDSDAQSTEVEDIFQKRLVTDDGTITTTTGDLVLDRPLSVRTVLIDGADTIQTLAARELGDPDKFREIVLLNNLKPPYISSLGGIGVLKPGDKILIPQLSPTLAPGGIVQNIEYQITKFLTQSEKNLGVDLRIDENNDLVFANFGDFDLYAGIDNIAQAILIRLGLEPGSLKRHPELGVGLEIGRKVRNVGEIRNRITSTLVQDARIDSVPYLNVQQEGSTTLINMIVKIRNLNEPVPLEIVV